MKIIILTKKKQKEIERKRNAIFRFIVTHPTNDVYEMSKAIDSLQDICWKCGVCSFPKA
jgi:hypothetical protein